MTTLIKVDPLNPNEGILRKAAQTIKEGGVVAFPTETVYGLGADCFNISAVLKIFQIKNRPADNPLIIHIYDKKQLEELVEGDIEQNSYVMDVFWPGPVTFIFRKKANVPKEVTGGLETVAIRMPSHPVAQVFLRLSGTPVAAPSANLSGKPSPTRAEHVIADLYGSVDVIIDGGETPLGLESTIVDLSRDYPVLLRPGPATIEEIKKIVPNLYIPDFLLKKENEPVKPLAPGMAYRHYAPDKPLILVINEKKLDEVLSKHPDSPIICPEEMSDRFYGRKTIIMGKLREPFTIAQNLFHVLREVDSLNAESVIVIGLEPQGILFSVMNRLKKAASEVID
ncbi:MULTISPECIES: L-threonylcarbamoyladenylate synthase [Pseudothermotoga]|jgi:L-threonylcarbamoyladenylate synthase|uniref:Threonylcarbamoyl-AMP synthase n=2 Tax=Pseudothermotoga TaxID=1643951 RepID=A8F706_PSELT|nr:MULTISPECIES: L-threonylcarbamoyladenylate synthase [Pseudothermotoga]ABV33940.1 Sua5/YciO/YrdC/YwlC family protein [Pseudothermotoga lettingae TMO]MDI3494625.1 L-threonylcarbamoyladenylate synthase [Pseudothermotoga sp.]MDK2884227.1 L-threonylcarbamoyladenylate synthase [Pseudothermotoga sp.]GLI49123.1 threonylcarbamoyl-AMP synthase [Pseudothermotoga lettingae TMO]HBJ82238.1 threonylcarbamoyl-AMP synthase [Pseudothermotoga sp.]